MLKLACLFVLSGAVALFGQQGRGTILGTVTDPSGAPIPGVKVSIVNSGTNVSLVAQTNSEGYYTSPALVVGTYQVVVEQPGFKREVYPDIGLQVDQHAEVNFSLTLGQVGDSVQVTGEVPLVNSSDATVGQVIENKRVEELPINGRSAFALIGLAANVKSNAGPTQSGFADRGTNLSAFSINGGPTATNYFLVDGMVAIQSYYPDLNADLAVDAVQEFKVQSGTMSAEYGLTAGGVINVATKSGTNQYHGSVYEFVRNNDFDARNTFATTVAPFHYNQYGIALGGPVIIPKLYNGRNKTFIFGNWEQWNYIMTSFPITTVPTAAERNGDFSQTYDATGKVIPIYDPATTIPNPAGSGYVRSLFPGNVIPTSRLDPVSVNILPFYPSPNRTPTNAFTNANNYIGPVSNTRRMQQYTIRGDQHFSDRDSLFARYTYFHHFDDNGAQSPWPNPVVRERNDNFETRNSVVSETHIFSPSVVNDIRLGTARQYFPFQVYSYGGDWPQKLGLPSSVPPTAFPKVSNGLTAFPTQTVGLRGALTWQFSDTVTIVHGSHSIKTGFEYRLLFGNNYQTSSPSGSYNFIQSLTGNPQSQNGTGSSLATFMAGYVSSASVTTHIGESEKGYAFAGFIQDDWRATRNLTLNIGLRYDYQSPPYERNNGLSNFFPDLVDPVNGLRGSVVYAGLGFHGGTFDPDYTDLGPRFGLAYNVGGHGTTVVRGGYAIYYPDTFNVQYFGNTNGFSTTTTTYSPAGNNANLAAFIFRNGLPSAPTLPQGSALGSDAFLGQAVTIDERISRTPCLSSGTSIFSASYRDSGSSMLPTPVIMVLIWYRAITT